MIRHNQFEQGHLVLMLTVVSASDSSVDVLKATDLCIHVNLGLTFPFSRHWFLNYFGKRTDLRLL